MPDPKQPAPAPTPPPAPVIEIEEFAEAAELAPAALAVFRRLYPGPLSRDGWLKALTTFTGRI